MTRVKAASFGVRFFRRGVGRTGEAPRPSGPDMTMQDNVFAQNQPSAARGDDMGEIVQPASKNEIHALQEHTSPRDVKASGRNDKYDGAGYSAIEAALWAAAKAGDCGAIRLAVMRGADLDARDSQGRTAINIATQYNHKDAIKTLLAAKEMRRMAALGELPQTAFFQKFSKTNKV